MAALKYLTGSVTQTGADTFTQAEVATGLQGIGNVAFRVKEIILYSGNPAEVDSQQIVSLTRKSFAAVMAITERSLIAQVDKTVRLTTSGMLQTRGFETFKYLDEDDLLVVEDPLYLSYHSVATALANVGRVRIGYEQVRISETDRLQLIAHTLAS